MPIKLIVAPQNFSLLPMLARILRLVFAALPLVCGAAHATDQLDLSTGLKTLLLLTDKISGPAIVAVVYDPASPQSKADADAIKEDMESGIGVPGGLQVSVQMMSAADFSRHGNINVAFMAEGMSAEAYGNVAAGAAMSGILTISTDVECVRANKCTLGVVTKPRVEIYYSAAAAAAAHVSFQPAFLMLVKQI